MNTDIFAAFVVVFVGDKIWATTRDGTDAGRIGLPGGKIDPGESPVNAVIREAYEEGIEVQGNIVPVRDALVEGKLVRWYVADSATSLTDYKEKHRGITPILVPLSDIVTSGYGNEFLAEFHAQWVCAKICNSA